MEKSDKNFLEKFADMVPGLGGYRAREERRTTDKRLREHLASRLDKARDRIEAVKLDLTNQGNIAALGGIGTVERKLQASADALRFATYGYSGFFDQVKIKEEQLDQLYAHDMKIADAVEALEKAVASPGYDGALAAGAVQSLEDLLSARKTLWDTP
jgi:hypothetical protein